MNLAHVVCLSPNVACILGAAEPATYLRKGATLESFFGDLTLVSWHSVEDEAGFPGADPAFPVLTCELDSKHDIAALTNCERYRSQVCDSGRYEGCVEYAAL